MEILRKYLNPSVINCIKCEENIMGKIQELYPIHFSKYKVRFTRMQVIDVLSVQEQEDIIIKTHGRAHRNGRENKLQILEKYYFPAMATKVKRIIGQCSVCKVCENGMDIFRCFDALNDVRNLEAAIKAVKKHF